MIAPESVFNISTDLHSGKSYHQFESVALSIFKHQYQHNPLYRKFCEHLDATDTGVSSLTEIPFLPIEFFKNKIVVSNTFEADAVFSSSGTTNSVKSKHFVTNINIYQESYRRGFAHFFGDISEYCVLALLPSYLEREGSSLIYMVDDFIAQSQHPASGFYLDALDDLAAALAQLDAQGTKILLIGVSFALLDLVERHRFNLKNTIVMETGGMKGRRKEMIREELHQVLQDGFGVTHIHSEYGMTELLSQAYSKGAGIFRCPPWMQIQIRDTEDPLTQQPNGKTGGINVIDLANFNSCSFIATQDLGKLHTDGSFEILGRFDHSDIRGCNLMML